MGPTEVDLRTLRGQAFEPCADRQLVVRMGEAEEPADSGVGVERGHSDASFLRISVLENPSESGRITTSPPYSMTILASGIVSNV